ncbi:MULTISPECIES: flagellar basal body rod protein FlgC [Caloramator]|uniref:Flagellar basal-body rod protein FlgC n=1 Tax=Caloramator proteoclasticus DSM 10124 TaxID=1121262 RepID=A0A1M4SV25_9CLOT|nr:MULTISPECIES: flagellar basal body rod protein FlgC [Caloramator]SHE35817.1 flagellar basal-body rod protein FlgC [Caloramator proteoclasticus DSM 10124]
MNNIFTGMRISASGLAAERLRMDIISNNIANIETTRTENGGPYKRKIVTFKENLERQINNINGNSSTKYNGVKVDKIIEDNSPFKKVYNPNHPDADSNGYVLMPNVNILDEMVDLITATRAFEANVTALNSQKQMALKALEIGK